VDNFAISKDNFFLSFLYWILIAVGAVLGYLSLYSEAMVTAVCADVAQLLELFFVSVDSLHVIF